jgi:hypothetical protein
MTVREAIQGAFRKKKLAAFEALADDTGAYDDRLSDYFSGADVATRQELASKGFEVAFRCTFNVIALPIATINEVLLPLLRAEGSGDSEADSSLGSRTIDMSFLDPLRDAEEESFLVPDKLYVRDCMRRVFGLFHEDVIRVPRRKPSKAYSAALIGSPGVGKSILFFLAALDQACASNVVYYRKSGEEPLSVFVMTPSDDGRSVRIWFSRNVASKSLDRGLSTASIALEKCRILDRGSFYDFVDGPLYGDRPNTFDGDYDYICPSSGFRRYKNDEYNKRLWILDGWTEDEAVTALVGLNNQSPAAAQHAYFLCGGIIRDMLHACSNGFAYAKGQMDELVEHCDKEALELVVGGTEERAEDPGNPNRLRTMFERRRIDRRFAYLGKRRMAACQVVDSPFVIDKLSATLPPKAWQKAHDYFTWWSRHRGDDTGAFIERLFSRTSFLD